MSWTNEVTNRDNIVETYRQKEHFILRKQQYN